MTTTILMIPRKTERATAVRYLLKKMLEELREATIIMEATEMSMQANTRAGLNLILAMLL
jgi:hypothetical protein